MRDSAFVNQPHLASVQSISIGVNPSVDIHHPCKAAEADEFILFTEVNIVIVIGGGSVIICSRAGLFRGHKVFPNDVIFRAIHTVGNAAFLECLDGDCGVAKTKHPRST